MAGKGIKKAMNKKYTALSSTIKLIENLIVS